MSGDIVGREVEERERLQDLRDGPWSQASVKARTEIGSTEFVGLAHSKARIAFDAHNLSRHDKDRLGWLQEVLRLHYERDISDQGEMDLRDSFDESLTYLQLLELSVETGYLSIRTIWEDARRELAYLLWSPAARYFVEGYDYLSVRFLAERVGVDLELPRVSPPDPRVRADLRFAAFLSSLEDWYCDPYLDAWLGLLDDYVVSDADYDERGALRAYLADGVPPLNSRSPERLGQLAVGMDHFLRVSNLFDAFKPRERPFYGTFYSYWLAKFFGWRRTGPLSPYKRDPRLDWSRFVEGPALIPTEVLPTAQLQSARAAELRHSTEILRDVWRDTRSLLEKSLRPDAPVAPRAR